MELNKFFFTLYLLEKKNELDKKIMMGYFDSLEDIYRAQGRLDMIKELYQEYNLEEVPNDEITYHKNL